MTRDGPTFTVVNNLGDQTETLVFKLGEKFNSSAFGVESEVSLIFQLRREVLETQTMFKRTLIYLDTDTQNATSRGNPLCRARKRQLNNR